jgi:hypothetical protein
MPKKILLTLPDNLDEKLQSMVKNGFALTKQQIILAILAERLLKNENAF